MLDNMDEEEAQSAEELGETFTTVMKRKTIKDHHGELVLMVDSSGANFYGTIDYRDADDRRGAFGMIGHPKKMMTSHNYSDVSEVYSISEDSRIV
tara:strand:+ start:3172 stop:3456 length:285 start_codon:yes stop_codon:yes gene_type:complete